MPKVKDLPKFSRPREKLLEKGPGALKDYELLAILLRTGYQGKSAIEVAKRILKTIGLERLPKLSIQELAKLKGVGKSRASTIAASIELSKRVFKIEKDVTIKSPEDVLKVASYLRNKKREYFVALYLNAKNQLIKSHIVSVGTLNTSLVHPREVFFPAIRSQSAQIVITHNHPSGSAKPSSEDIEITKRLAESGRILGIEIVDHIIISKDDFVSLKDLQIL